MVTLRRFSRRIVTDFYCDDQGAALFLWLANAVPNLYTFKIVKNFFLKAAGVRTKLDNVYFKSRIAIDSPRALTIGRGVFINRNVIFEGTGHVSLCGNCQIGPNVVFATSSHDICKAMSTTVGDIEVKDNVWIGAGVIVLSNIELGPNVVVAAGSVVTKSFANCVVAGVPARCVRQLEETYQARP